MSYWLFYILFEADSLNFKEILDKQEGIWTFEEFLYLIGLLFGKRNVGFDEWDEWVHQGELAVQLDGGVLVDE